jgi:predicted acetyltransferase
MTRGDNRVEKEIFMFFGTEDLKSDEIFLNLSKTSEAQPEKRWLPAYYFDICLLDGTKVGHCDLRIGHNEKTYMGGNIGYGIDEPYRGRRYAAKACRLLFAQAQKHRLDHVYITCTPDNIASARTCEIAGGELVEVAAVPEDNEMYAEGKRQVKIYRFAL